MIKKGWKKVKLGDLFELNYGKGLPKRRREKGVYPVFGSGGKIDLHNEFLIKGPGIIVGRKGNVGSIFYSKNNYFPIDTVFYINENPSKYNLKFLYYLLKSSNLPKLDGDAAVPGLNRNTAYLQEYYLPQDIKEQNKIATILSNYDDLIENNTKRIELLENIAQLIYKEWFVHFRYPRYKTQKLVDSELGKIPEGWEVKKLKDYVDFIKGVEPGSKNYQEKNESGLIPFLRVGDLTGTRISNIFINRELAKNRILNNNDIAVTFDGTIGIVKRGLDGCYSSGIRKLIIKNKMINKSYLYFLMMSDLIQKKIEEHAKGTTILHAGGLINYIKFILPNEIIINKFDEIINPLLKNLLYLQQKNDILIKTRD